MMKLSIVFIFLAIIAGCQPSDQNREEVIDESGADMNEYEMADTVTIHKAVAVLQPTEGNKIKGLVTFTKSGNTITVVTDISGLKPGKHGFHIHEFGDCSAPDASSAGDHFAPAGNQHGAPIDQNRHAGDLGNIEADASGKAHLEWSDNILTFSGMNSIIGHAVVVHENMDDLTSQPSGNAGARLACGVIGIAKE